MLTVVAIWTPLRLSARPQLPEPDSTQTRGTIKQPRDSCTETGLGMGNSSISCLRDPE